MEERSTQRNTWNLKGNLPGEDASLRNLKNGKVIIILAVDRGNAIVVMNTSDYKKIQELLDPSTYKKSAGDPTSRPLLETNWTEDVINTRRHKKLLQKSKAVSGVYGLLKIHKSDIPLQPT